MSKMSVKIMIAILALLSGANFAQARVIVEEEFFVRDPSKQFLNLLQMNQQLSFDHLQRGVGYEVFGPRGTREVLERLGANFVDLKSIEKTNAAGYIHFPEFEAKMKEMQGKYSNIMRLFSVGKTTQGRDMWMMKISNNPNISQVKPRAKYISSMHGDEITGRELLLAMIEEIGNRYATGDSEIRTLVDNTELFIMPSMNPDGTELHQRANAQYVDLNRDFPDFSVDDHNTPSGRAPETAAIMAFQAANNIALSANFHGGAQVVNYPWDSLEARFPFDALVQDLSLGYASRAAYIYQSSEFANGITNGYDWYLVNGGMQDWSYHYYNDLQLTIELSNAKWPDYSMIPDFYKKNHDSLLFFLGSVHRGAGFALNKPEISGTVRIFALLANGAEKDIGVYNFAHSDFYKVLENGKYRFEVQTKATADAPAYAEKFVLSVDGNFVPNGNFYKINL